MDRVGGVHTLPLFDILREAWYTCSMKQTIAAKLKLHTTQEQFQSLRTTQLSYRDALNAVSRYAFEHGKMSNQRALQEGMYEQISYRLQVYLPRWRVMSPGR